MPTYRESVLLEELERLQALISEPMQTLEAIRSGQVDAFVVSETEDIERVCVLKSADRLYQQIVEEMGDGAVTLSPDGEIAYCNPQFERLATRERYELLGYPMRQFLTEETRAVFDALLKRSDRSSARAEVELSTPGGPIPVAIASTLLDDADGSQYCLILSDLRDQHSREQLRAAKDAAELANRSKDDFLAMVSHELRSPITVILGWTRMMQMNRVDRDTTVLAIDSIHSSTARLLKLVDDILDASRLNAGRLTLQREVVDFRRSIQSALDSVRFEVEQLPITVETRMPEEPVLILADSDRLHQIVVNLVGNALKFTPPHGRLEVELEVAEGVARLEVRDTGEGIDPAFLPFVFERFRQDDSSTTRAHRGLGLGLAIVKQLLEAHGGGVTAHSAGKGKGATFTVTMPLTAQTVALAIAAHEEPLPALHGTRVLLVDDEADTIAVIRSILLSGGATVETAMTVQDALVRAAEFRPHIIVSDIAMPGEDGYQFLRRLSAHAGEQSSVPVLAMTGKSTPSDRDAILAAGFQSYIRKPVEPDELIRTIFALRG